MTRMLGAQLVTVTRRGPVTWIEGLPQRPPPDNFTLRASVQAMSGRQLERVPEGLRSHDWQNLYAPTTPVLRTAEADGPEADLVTVGGVTYEIQRVRHWGTHRPRHIHYEMVSKSGTDGAPVGEDAP